jgi:hypothetical protein
MDIETKIALGFLICFVAGLFIGWYVTWQKYHQEEEKRKAVANAINHERIKTPPKTEWDEFIDIIAKLNNTDVDEYRIVYGDDVFVMTSKMEPKTEEEKA